MITVTESAVKQLCRMREGAPAETPRALRLSVERGGCAGMQYGMEFTTPNPTDLPIEQGGIVLYVDPASVDFLRGSELDYEDGLTGNGFRLRNPNATRSCGCGTSFEPTQAA